MPVTFQPVELGEHTQPAYLALNPLGKVPTLTGPGFTLFESVAILVWAERHGSGPALNPAAPEPEVRMWQMIGIAQGPLSAQAAGGLFLHRVLSPVVGWPVDEARVAAAVSALGPVLDLLEAQLATAPWLAGEALSLADILAVTPIDGAARAPEGAALLAARPQLAAWLERMRTRPSVQQTWPAFLDRAA